MPTPLSPPLAYQELECSAVGQDAAGRGEKGSCDERENERERDVMATTGWGCGVTERPLVAGKGEEAGGSRDPGADQVKINQG